MSTKPADPKPQDDAAQALRLQEVYRRIREEMAKFIVGQDEVIEQLLIAVLAGGHVLLEGVPGLAKTAMVRSLARTMDLSFRRIQFTPDLMPADITGTEIIQEDPTNGRRNLVFQRGPIFAQMVLADEINRTPPKTQSALLEAMQEHSVTVGGHTSRLEEPFFVLATQNPIEQEGTYPLPEAQKDRFLFHVKVDYPDREEEREIVVRTTSAFSADLRPVIGGAEIVQCQQLIRRVPVPEHVMDFTLDLVRATRPAAAKAGTANLSDLIAWGAGPRACQCLILGGKVRALLRGRTHVTLDDVEAVSMPVLRHRLVATFNAEAEGVTVEEIVRRVIASVPRHSPASAL